MESRKVEAKSVQRIGKVIELEVRSECRPGRSEMFWLSGPGLEARPYMTGGLG